MRLACSRASRWASTMSTSDPRAYATDPGVPTSPSLGGIGLSPQGLGLPDVSLLTRLANEIFSSGPGLEPGAGGTSYGTPQAQASRPAPPELSAPDPVLVSEAPGSVPQSAGTVGGAPSAPLPAESPFGVPRSLGTVGGPSPGATPASVSSGVPHSGATL